MVNGESRKTVNINLWSPDTHIHVNMHTYTCTHTYTCKQALKRNKNSSFKIAIKEISIVAQACNPNTWETEEGESRVQDQLELIVRPCLKKNLELAIKYLCVASQSWFRIRNVNHPWCPIHYTRFQQSSKSGVGEKISRGMPQRTMLSI